MATGRFRFDNNKITIWFDDESGFMVRFPQHLRNNPKAWEAFGRKVADREAGDRIVDGEAATIDIGEDFPTAH